MCEVNDGGTIEGDSVIKEDDALEKIFSECDVSSTGRVPVTTLIGYMRDHMSTQGSPEILKDLRKSMRLVSFDGEVTRKQYYEVSRRWLDKIRKFQHYQDYNYQDGNNNLRDDNNSVDSFNDDSVDLPFNVEPGGTTKSRTTNGSIESAEDGHLNTTGSGSESEAKTLQGMGFLSSSTCVDIGTRRCRNQDSFFGDISSVDGTYDMAVDDPVFETTQDLRKRAHRCAADNDHLKGELQRAEDSIATLERQLAAMGRKLELATSRCDRLQKENDEHRELLAVAEKDRETLGVQKKRLERDNYLFGKEIKATESEMRRLNVELDRANEQKEEQFRLLARCRQEIIERQALYDEIREQKLQIESVNDQLREKHDISISTIEHLKIVVKELETKISELQRNQNYILHGEGILTSPPSDNGLDCEMEIRQDFDGTMPRSLHAEMQASDPGYTEIDISNETIADRETTNSDLYVGAMRRATEQLERATAEFAASYEEPLTRSQDSTENLLQLSEDEERSPRSEELQRFNRQIRLALTALSLLSSRRIVTADTKDATNQLDHLDLVPAKTAGCNINADGMNYADDNENNRFCLGGVEKVETSLVGTISPVVAPSAISTDPSVTSLEVTPKSSRVTSTPRLSPELNSPPISPGYLSERSIIVPIVAALDKIIQGSSGNSSSDEEAFSSPTESRREPNPRYIYTLPSARPSDLENEPSPDTESQPQSLQMTKQIVDDQQSIAWRCPGSSIADDTSDDTYGTGSLRSRSPSPVGVSSVNADSTDATEDGAANRPEKTGVNESETYQNHEPPSPAPDQISPDNHPHGTDVVEGLNLDLERLSLRTSLASCEDQQRGKNIVNTRDCGKASKRKTSVYNRSFVYPLNKSTFTKESSSTTCATEVRDNQPQDHPSHSPEPNLAAEDRDDMKTAHELGEENSSTSKKPTKSEVNLGVRQSEYVSLDDGISCTPQPTQIPTPCLFTDDVAPRTNTAEKRVSEVRKVSGRSRSVVCAMSSDEDSSDSECARDHVNGVENSQVVVKSLPPTPPSPSSSSAPQPPQRLMQMQLQIQPYQLPTLTPLPLPQQQQASLQQPSTIAINSDYLFDDSSPYNVEQSVRIEDVVAEDDSRSQSKDHKRLRRSLSESDREPLDGSIECRSRNRCIGIGNTITRNHEENNVETAAEDFKNQQIQGVFPSLPDARLVELGLASPLNAGLDLCERVGEDELEQKYTSLSIGLGTDRITLPQRLALSIRQRDQAERNLTTEVEKMHQDIQSLAPLCVDRESVERVERVRHQLEMISRCALRVSCTAELLGATHQERRVSMAALLADRYLQALRARCEKLSADLAETKRILAENNIVVEESPSELIDDVVSRVRYRAVPSTNRTTMSRRRASIATISRPTNVNSLQDAMKDNGRQHRTSVPARMTLRRPSLGYDMQRWDNDKLDRTDSSSSIGELREIFEQAESRRGSKEENNNLIHSQSSNFSAGSCESGDSDVWASTREDHVNFLSQSGDEQLLVENRFISRRTPRVLRTLKERISRLPLSWYILFVAVFFFGFYSNRYVTSKSAVPLKWWSVDEIIKRYTRVQRSVPRPI